MFWTLKASCRTVRTIINVPSIVPHRTLHFLPPITTFPSKVAYIKPCRCWHLRPFIDFDPEEKDTEPFERSYRLIGDEGEYSSSCELGEVAVDKDGLLHPKSACEAPPSRSLSTGLKLQHNLRTLARYSFPDLRKRLHKIPLLRVVSE